MRGVITLMIMGLGIAGLAWVFHSPGQQPLLAFGSVLLITLPGIEWVAHND